MYDGQWRIFIFIEGVAPQGFGSKGNKSWTIIVIHIKESLFTYPKVGINSEKCAYNCI